MYTLIKGNYKKFSIIALALAISVAMAGFLFAATASAADPASPTGCNADNSVVNISRSTAVATVGQTITFTVSAGNVASADGCDITNRTMTLTLPNGSTQVFGPNNYPNPSSVAVAGSANYVAAAADLVAGQWNASVTWTGTQKDGFDSPSNGTKGTSVNQIDAKISITPNGTNEINHNHVFTGHVDVNPGTGFVNAPDGTQISFTADSGPGSFTTTNPCTTSGGTGSCAITLSSAVTGVTTVSAHTTVTVAGTPLTRNTDSTGANSGPAIKTWVDANIQISPAQDTDPINDNHVLTGHVNVNTGTGGYVNAPAGTTIHFAIASGPGSLTPVSGDCLTIATTGSCTVTLTSPIVGTSVVNASTTVSVGGVTLNRTTDGVGSNSGPANKIWINNTVSMVTAIHNGTNHATAVTSVSAGSTVHDSATLTFSGPAPTGNVDFTFWTGGSNCDSGVSSASGSVPIVAGVAHPSTSQGPLAAGSYAFKAHWAGDANYPNGATSDCEPLTVTQNHPSLGTTPSAGGNVGVVLNDTGTLTGAYLPTGNIDFKLFDPSDATCSGAGVYSQSVALSGNSATTSPGYTSLVAGIYRWIASYAGDINNVAASSGCQDEQVTTTQPAGQWCSPGYWRNHLDAWGPTGISQSALYSLYFPAVVVTKKGTKDGAPADPTLLQVVQHPDWYGGEAFNNVADLLSSHYPGFNFTLGDPRIENCPLN